MQPHQNTNIHNSFVQNNNLLNPFWMGNKQSNSLLTLTQLQIKCNLELIKNQMLIGEYMKIQKDDKQRQKGFSQTSASSKNQKQNQIIQNQIKQKKKKRIPTNISRKMDQSQYEPQDFEDYECTSNYKISQSKNIPKSFGKSIINFIKRNNQVTNKVLKLMGIEYQQFDKIVNKYKGKINTIIQLRSLWLQQDNQYAKAFRILSQVYLKKHSLSHIFNSRIQNYSKHLKYRTKILQSIQKPEQFTQMKDY